MRTQEEIVEQVKKKSLAQPSLLHFEVDALISCLTFENAKPWLKENVTEEDWECEEDVRATAVDHLRFAWDKASGHRGISASRSVDKLTAYCWVLGLETSLIADAPYAQYGCPQLKVIAELLGEPLPTDKKLLRMMAGQSCVSHCEQGCGS